MKQAEKINLKHMKRRQPMNKVIGGLLILTLLGRPAIIKVDYIAYEILKSNDIIINYLRKNDVLEIEIEKEEDKISLLMQEIDENKRQINTLVGEKKQIVASLENTMKTKAMSREILSEEFILEFKEFNELYAEERNSVQAEINAIINTDFNSIQKEILHNETDYEYIIAEFEQLAYSQNSIILFLKNLVNKGNQTLALCC